MTQNDVLRVCIVGEESPLTTRLIELLLKNPQIHVVLASSSPVKMFRERVSITQISLSTPDLLISVFKGMSLVINALPPSPQARINVFKSSHLAGVSAIDTMQDLPSLMELQGRKKEFDDNYTIFVPGAGFSPGLSEVLASSLAMELDNIEEIKILIALGRNPNDPKEEYWNFAEMLNRDPKIYHNGKFINESKEIYYEGVLPIPIGSLKARIMEHDELYTLSKRLPSTKIVTYGNLRGFLGRTYPFLKGQLTKLFEGESKGLSLIDKLDFIGIGKKDLLSGIKVEAIGTRRGVSLRMAYSVVDSITRITSSMAAAAAINILENRAMGSGLRWVSTAFSPDILLQSLAKLGLRYIYEEEVLSSF